MKTQEEIRLLIDGFEESLDDVKVKFDEIISEGPPSSLREDIREELDFLSVRIQVLSEQIRVLEWVLVK